MPNVGFANVEEAPRQVQKPTQVFELHWHPAMQGRPDWRFASQVLMEHHESPSHRPPPQMVVQLV